MRDLLFLSMVRWDTIWQRPQHLAIELSKYFRILYVDPVAYSFPGAIRNHIFGDHSRNFRPLYREINNNLLVYTPKPMIPCSEDFWFINEADHKFLWDSLLKLLSKIFFADPILYINSPFQLPILKRFPNSIACYDCMDQYEGFYKPMSRRRRLVLQKEEALLSQIRVIFATSENLERRFSEQNKNVHLIRNGVSKLFLDYGREPSSQPNDFPSGRGPIVGYVGAISNWFDIKVIQILAEKHPDWRFVLIGPVNINVGSLKNIKNVHFLGVKEYSLLPSYVNQFDIAIMPFKLNELTKAVNPIKVYEYFALGKMVVATRLPELEKFSDACSLADSSSDFISKVEIAVDDVLNMNQLALSNLETQLKNIALDNSWQLRAESIYTIITAEK